MCRSINVCIYEYLCIYLSIYYLSPSIFPSIQPPMYSSIYPPLHPFTHPSIQLCIYPSIHPCVYSFIPPTYLLNPSMHPPPTHHPQICPSIHPSTHLSTPPPSTTHPLLHPPIKQTRHPAIPLSISVPHKFMLLKPLLKTTPFHQVA